MLKLCGGQQAHIYKGDMAVHCALQRTPGTMVEDGEQNKLDNSPCQVLRASILASGDFEVGYVNQWTLEGFLQSWGKKINNTSELLKPLEQSRWSVCHIRALG